MRLWQARQRARHVLIGLWVTLIATTVTACGAPRFTYVADAGDHMYFKVPHGWHTRRLGARRRAQRRQSIQPARQPVVGGL